MSAPSPFPPPPPPSKWPSSRGSSGTSPPSYSLFANKSVTQRSSPPPPALNALGDGGEPPHGSFGAANSLTYLMPQGGSASQNLLRPNPYDVNTFPAASTELEWAQPQPYGEPPQNALAALSLVQSTTQGLQLRSPDPAPDAESQAAAPLPVPEHQPVQQLQPPVAVLSSGSGRNTPRTGSAALVTRVSGAHLGRPLTPRSSSLKSNKAVNGCRTTPAEVASAGEGHGTGRSISETSSPVLPATLRATAVKRPDTHLGGAVSSHRLPSTSSAHHSEGRKGVEGKADGGSKESLPAAQRKSLDFGREPRDGTVAGRSAMSPSQQQQPQSRPRSRGEELLAAALRRRGGSASESAATAASHRQILSALSGGNASRRNSVSSHDQQPPPPPPPQQQQPPPSQPPPRHHPMPSERGEGREPTSAAALPRPTSPVVPSGGGPDRGVVSGHHAGREEEKANDDNSDSLVPLLPACGHGRHASYPDNNNNGTDSFATLSATSFVQMASPLQRDQGDELINETVSLGVAHLRGGEEAARGPQAPQPERAYILSSRPIARSMPDLLAGEVDVRGLPNKEEILKVGQPRPGAIEPLPGEEAPSPVIEADTGNGGHWTTSSFPNTQPEDGPNVVRGSDEAGMSGGGFALHPGDNTGSYHGNNTSRSNSATTPSRNPWRAETCLAEEQPSPQLQHPSVRSADQVPMVPRKAANPFQQTSPVDVAAEPVTAPCGTPHANPFARSPPPPQHPPPPPPSQPAPSRNPFAEPQAEVNAAAERAGDRPQSDLPSWRRPLTVSGNDSEGTQSSADNGKGLQPLPPHPAVNGEQRQVHPPAGVPPLPLSDLPEDHHHHHSLQTPQQQQQQQVTPRDARNTHEHTSSAPRQPNHGGYAASPYVRDPDDASYGSDSPVPQPPPRQNTSLPLSTKGAAEERNTMEEQTRRASVAAHHDDSGEEQRGVATHPGRGGDALDAAAESGVQPATAPHGDGVSAPELARGEPPAPLPSRPHGHRPDDGDGDGGGFTRHPVQPRSPEHSSSLPMSAPHQQPPPPSAGQRLLQPQPPPHRAAQRGQSLPISAHGSRAPSGQASSVNPFLSLDGVEGGRASSQPPSHHDEEGGSVRSTNSHAAAAVSSRGPASTAGREPPPPLSSKEEGLAPAMAAAPSAAAVERTPGGGTPLVNPFGARGTAASGPAPRVRRPRAPCFALFIPNGGGVVTCFNDPTPSDAARVPRTPSPYSTTTSNAGGGGQGPHGSSIHTWSMMEALTSPSSLASLRGIQSTPAGRSYADAVRAVAQSPFFASAGTSSASSSPVPTDRLKGLLQTMCNGGEGSRVLPPLQAILSAMLEDASAADDHDVFLWSKGGAKRLAGLLTDNVTQTPGEGEAGEASVASSRAPVSGPSETAKKNHTSLRVPSVREPSPVNPAYLQPNASARSNAALLESGLARVQSLLCMGEREAAVDVALESGLHTHAVLIAMMCATKDAYMKAVNAVVHEVLDPCSPLAHAYCLFNELPLPPFIAPLQPPPPQQQQQQQQQPQASSGASDTARDGGVEGSDARAQENPREEEEQRAKERRAHDRTRLSATWRQQAAVLVSNFTRSGGEALLSLGDALQRAGLVAEAHACFLSLHLCPLASPAATRQWTRAPRPEQRAMMEQVKQRLGVLGGFYHPTESCRNTFLSPVTTLLTDLLQQVRLTLDPRRRVPADAEAVEEPPLHALPARPPRYTIAFHFMQVLWLREVGMASEADRAMGDLLSVMPAPSPETAFRGPPRTLNELVFIFGGVLEAGAPPPPPPPPLPPSLSSSPPTSQQPTVGDPRGTPLQREDARAAGAAPDTERLVGARRQESPPDATATTPPPPPPPRAPSLQKAEEGGPPESPQVTPPPPGHVGGGPPPMGLRKMPPPPMMAGKKGFPSLPFAKGPPPGGRPPGGPPPPPSIPQQQQPQQQPQQPPPHLNQPPPPSQPPPPPPQRSGPPVPPGGSVPRLPPPPPPPFQQPSQTHSPQTHSPPTRSPLQDQVRPPPQPQRPPPPPHQAPPPQQQQQQQRLGDPLPWNALSQPNGESVNGEKEGHEGEGGRQEQERLRLMKPKDDKAGSGDGRKDAKEKEKPRRSRSLDALLGFFGRGRSTDKEKEEEAKPMILDTAKPPKFDPVTGRWLFAQTAEEKAQEALVRAGPPKIVPRKAMPPPPPAGAGGGSGGAEGGRPPPPPQRGRPGGPGQRPQYVDVFNS